jgi:ABC-type multidrug transport system fused ATPase/permease subunit
MISFTLGNHGDAIVVHAYHWLQAHAISWLSKLVGSLPAQLLLTPLYLFSVVLFAIAFACQSRGALAVIVAALLGCGVSPLNVPLILGDLLLLSGFYLVSNECLHLPRWIEERLELTEAQRELLTELEKRPLSEAEVRFFLSEDEPSSSKAASGNVVRQLRELGAAGLVEYSQQNKRFHATEVLKKSTAAIAVAWLANAIAWAGALGLLLLAVAYDLLPLHLPGFLDDIVVTILGAVPLYLKIRQQLKRLS